MDALENPQQAAQHLTGFLDVAEVILSSPKDASRAGPLLELLLPVSTDSAPPQQVLRIYAGLVRAYPSKKDYRAAFAERFERLHPLASPERVFYEASGFATHQNPAAALSRLEKLLRFREGAYVVHASGWGVGKVLAVDPFLKQVRVDLEHKKDHRIAIDAVDSILEPLPPDSFLALSHEGGAELRRLREEDPVRLVSMLLDTFGNPLALKDIKSRLVPAVIEPSGWNKWWNRVKGALRDTGVFRVGDRAPYTVERLQLAVSYEDELVHTFLRAEWPQARQIARLVARRNANELENAWQKIRERLLSVSNSSGGRGVNVIEAALIIDRGDGGKSKDFLRSILARFSSQDLSTVFQELSGAEEQRRAVESLPDTRPDDWEEITSTLFAGKKDTLRDAAVDLLEKRCPEKIQSLLKDLVKNPKASPEAFCFMLQSHIEGSSHSSLEVFRSRGPRELLVLVTDLLDHLQHLAERRGRLSYKEIVRRVEDILGQGDRRFFLDGLKAMSSEDRRDLYTRLVRNESLLPQLKGALLQCILEAEPSLVQEKELPPWEEDCIYVTAAGLEKRKDEFREIMEVKLPKVFEDIGRAAAFGDLSENAEYTSALEERDSLTKRATKIKAELDKATIIVPDMVRKDRAGLGSRIHLVNLRTGDKFVYSVLGPWDGSPEDGILNYLSPLGRLFHGRTEGEEVEAQLPGGTEMYKLAKIGSHFEKDS
jgi:transcription elongation factor GreA